MKYLIALFIALTLFGCAKDNITAPVEPASNPLVGKWAYQGISRVEITANTFTMYDDYLMDWVPYPGSYSYTAQNGMGELHSNNPNIPYSINGKIPFTYSVDEKNLVFNCYGVSYTFQRI